MWRPSTAFWGYGFDKCLTEKRTKTHLTYLNHVMNDKDSIELEIFIGNKPGITYNWRT